MTKGSPVSIIPGFEDLKPKDVLVFNANGTVMLEVNGKIELYQMQICADRYLHLAADRA
jgi:hypothetical protein